MILQKMIQNIWTNKTHTRHLRKLGNTKQNPKKIKCKLFDLIRTCDNLEVLL